MRSVKRSMAVAAVSTLALFASACGGGDGDDDDNEGATESSITVRGCNPENPLIPSNTAETCGGNVQDVTTAKLIHYKTSNAEPENDIAESIETEDNQHFTVKLKEGYMFSDGTEVLAKNFVDAWNYAAYQPNAYEGSYFMGAAQFVGYADLQCDSGDAVLGEEEDPCVKFPPKAKEMSGLKVVDDHTFTIETDAKVSNLPVRLGYTAFAPLPDSFFADPEAFGKLPVSAGPYKVESWTPNKDIVLVKNDKYSGDFEGNVDKIIFKIYTDPTGAYADLVAGNIDVSDDIPLDVLTDDKWLQELDNRGEQREEGVIQFVAMDPTVDARLTPDVRKAISMAIDRETITKEIFAGTRNPASGWVSPVVDGYKEGQCGDACTYDPAAAKALLDSAGGFTGKLTISINGDSDHRPWAEAVCNSIRQALGIDCTPKETPDFATLLTSLEKKEVKGLFRYGWQMDYPSIENFLVPLYSKTAGSNYFSFDNPTFEQLTKDAAAALDPAEANELYQQAELEIAKDMRVIPLWYTTSQVGWSDKVDNVTTNAFGVPDYAAITVK